MNERVDSKKKGRQDRKKVRKRAERSGKDYCETGKGGGRKKREGVQDWEKSGKSKSRKEERSLFRPPLAMHAAHDIRERQATAFFSTDEAKRINFSPAFQPLLLMCIHYLLFIEIYSTKKNEIIVGQ